jgi:hypothetical protein
MVVFIRSMGYGQRQQGKRQSEKQTAHDGSPESKMNNLLCNLIT